MDNVKSEGKTHQNGLHEIIHLLAHALNLPYPHVLLAGAAVPHIVFAQSFLQVRVHACVCMHACMPVNVRRSKSPKEARRQDGMNTDEIFEVYLAPERIETLVKCAHIFPFVDSVVDLTIGFAQFV